MTVYNMLQSRRENQATATCTENLLKFGRAVQQICSRQIDTTDRQRGKQAGRQTERHRQTDILITTRTHTPAE